MMQDNIVYLMETTNFVHVKDCTVKYLYASIKQKLATLFSEHGIDLVSTGVLCASRRKRLSKGISNAHDSRSRAIFSIIHTNMCSDQPRKRDLKLYSQVLLLLLLTYL